jgi:site-specific recombinase XerD
LAKLALHFGQVPTEIDPDQINDYLYMVKQEHNIPSDSYFKFTVYGLRFAYRCEGLRDKRIELPEIKRGKKLPIVLSRQEVKRLLKAPKLLKHKLLLGLLYGSYLGTDTSVAPPFALHRSGWWLEQSSKLENGPKQRQVFISGESHEQSVPCQICGSTQKPDCGSGQESGECPV